MHLSFRFIALLCGVFAAGLFVGLLLPAIWIVIIQGLLLLFIAFSILCD